MLEEASQNEQEQKIRNEALLTHLKTERQILAHTVSIRNRFTRQTFNVNSADFTNGGKRRGTLPFFLKCEYMVIQ